MFNFWFQTIESGGVQRFYSGTPCLQPFISSTTTVRVLFRTDHSNVHEGFIATYKSRF